MSENKQPKNDNSSNDEEMYVCMEIAAAESIPELNKEAPKAK